MIHYFLLYFRFIIKYESVCEKNMQEQILKIKNSAAQEISLCKDLEQVISLRVKYLGKKGELSLVLKQMGKLSPGDRKRVGQLANSVRNELENALEEKMKNIKLAQQQNQMRSERVDVTLPGKKFQIGRVHPLSKVMDEINNIFIGMGFSIVEGPEIETDHYNFEALNIPKNHPARDTQDTFYIDDELLLRTQTSPVQIRVMEKQSPPIRIISPGRVFRSDSVDSTHSPVFHQIEGLVVDRNITMADLKGTLKLFVDRLYGKDSKVKFRPHHFPFTEPSAEMDVMCFSCQGNGCSLCKQEGWIEILGCGMVHPKVLKNCGIDPEVYSGFAFGMGLERIVMRRYNIDDLRLFFENDVRFLSQF